MQRAPVMKGSGLKPLDESKKDDEVAHVFGKNLEERVITNEGDAEATIANLGNDQKHDDDIDTIKKRKFEAITGEEDEETIFQGEFKLFAWDLETSNWIEIGRGQLKLNDSIDTDATQSRLIMRVGGTHKIILNVAVRYPSFKVIASTKNSIRFTDSLHVWAASGSNALQLNDLIESRLKISMNESENAAKRLKPQDYKASETEESETQESQTNDTPAQSSAQQQEPQSEVDSASPVSKNEPGNTPTHVSDGEQPKQGVENSSEDPKDPDTNVVNVDRHTDTKDQVEETHQPLTVPSPDVEEKKTQDEKKESSEPQVKDTELTGGET